MILMVSYYLPLLPWSMKAIDSLATSIIFLSWRREEIVELGWVALKHCVFLKDLAGYEF